MIEPSLHRLFKRQNVNFKQVSVSRDIYSIRAPYTIDRTELLKETEEDMLVLFKEYGEDVDLSLLLGEEDAFTAS